MARVNARIRVLVGSAALLAGLVAAPAVAQSPDECIALNGVRYATPDDATTAQYVGVSGACTAANDPDAEVQVVPIGGAGGAGTADGGTARDVGGAAPTTASPEAGDASATDGTATPRRAPAGGEQGTARGAGPDAATGDTADVTAQVRVAQALSSADDAPPQYVSGDGLLSPQTGGGLVAALAVVAAALGLRRRLN